MDMSAFVNLNSWIMQYQYGLLRTVFTHHVNCQIYKVFLGDMSAVFEAKALHRATSVWFIKVTLETSCQEHPALKFKHWPHEIPTMTISIGVIVLIDHFISFDLNVYLTLFSISCFSVLSNVVANSSKCSDVLFESCQLLLINHNHMCYI